MTSRRRSVIALLVTGIVGMIAFAGIASAQSVNTSTTTTLGIRAFVDNGFTGALVGVPGGAVALKCQSPQQVQLALTGTASNGMAKANYNDEGNSEETFSEDDLDNTDQMPLNLVNGGFEEVTGHMEFVNGNQNRTLTLQYSTEDTPPNSSADCAVWGTAIKGIG